MESQNQQVENLSREFSRVLNEWLTPVQMAEVIATNEENEGDGTCATHDYCDANEAMAEAFEKVVGRPSTMVEDVENNPELEARQDADTKLWNEAWDLAKYHKFYLSESELLLNEKFERQLSGGANWSVPTWKIPGTSPDGFDMYICDSNEDESEWDLIDRDWADERDEAIVTIFSSANLQEVLAYVAKLKVASK